MTPLIPMTPKSRSSRQKAPMTAMLFRLLITGTTAGTLALGVLAGATTAHAFTPETRFTLAILDVHESVRERQAGVERLAVEVRKRTSVQAEPAVAFVPLEAGELFRFPFVVLPVCRELPPLSDEDTRLLRRYLDVGGLLLIDNCQGRPDGAAANWINDQIQRLYPRRTLAPLPSEHSIFRAFYLLDRAYGRTMATSDVMSITDGGRTLIILQPNDMFGALMHDAFGNPIFQVTPRHREMTRRQGVNLVLYALTMDYKEDQIHIPFILQRRRP